MTVEKHLDYIQASVDISETALSSETIATVPPLSYYKRGYRDANGTRYYFGNPNSKKALLVMSGTALQSVRNSGYDDKDIAASLREKGAKFTRLDIALTQYDDDNMVSLRELQLNYSDGLIESPLVARGGTIISKLELDGEVYPETFYIGDLKKRAKKGLFRAYDKGKMLDITRDLMIRLELEERGHNAHSSAMRIANGASVSSVFRSRFDIKTDKFQSIIDAEPADISRGKASDIKSEETPEEKRWRWLIEQVAPTLRKALNENITREEADRNLFMFLHAAGMHGRLRDFAEAIAKFNKSD